MLLGKHRSEAAAEIVHHRVWPLWSGLWIDFNHRHHHPLPLIDAPTATETRWLQPGEEGARAGPPPLNSTPPPPSAVWNICVDGMSECLNLFVAPLFAGLCSPLEKRLLRLGAHSPSRILLHHSSNTSGQDQAAHPLLWRYSPELIRVLSRTNRNREKREKSGKDTGYNLHWSSEESHFFSFCSVFFIIKGPKGKKKNVLKKTWTWFQGNKGCLATSAALFDTDIKDPQKYLLLTLVMPGLFPPVSLWDIDIREVEQRLHELMFSSAWTLITLLMP